MSTTSPNLGILPIGILSLNFLTDEITLFVFKAVTLLFHSVWVHCFGSWVVSMGEQTEGKHKAFMQKLHKRSILEQRVPQTTQLIQDTALLKTSFIGCTFSSGPTHPFFEDWLLKTVPCPSHEHLAEHSNERGGQVSPDIVTIFSTMRHRV